MGRIQSYDTAVFNLTILMDWNPTSADVFGENIITSKMGLKVYYYKYLNMHFEEYKISIKWDHTRVVEF